MPYITEEDRNELSAITGYIHIEGIKNAGEIQYLIAEIIQEFLSSKNGARYQDMNDVMGALAGAQAEFYRIVVAPYEDEKIKENGGVYNVKCGKSY